MFRRSNSKPTRLGDVVIGESFILKVPEGERDKALKAKVRAVWIGSCDTKYYKSQFPSLKFCYSETSKPSFKAIFPNYTSPNNSELEYFLVLNRCQKDANASL